LDTAGDRGIREIIGAIFPEAAVATTHQSRQKAR
jgi:hypothetical protein